MSEPDELYTLRALYWLGHYELCLEEGKSISRNKPLPGHLKVEKEHFVLRALLALKQYDKVIHDAAGEDKGVGIQALALQAQYENPKSTMEEKATAVTLLEHCLLHHRSNDNSSTNTNIQDTSSSYSLLQLVAGQVFLSTGTKLPEALQCVYVGTTLEHLSLMIQIYLKMNRFDLAWNTCELMRQADEEAILTQLSSCHCKMIMGRTMIHPVIHTLSTLVEQYGPSAMLFNMMATAYMIRGNTTNSSNNSDDNDNSFIKAEHLLQQAMVYEEEKMNCVSVDTLINLLTCLQHMGKGIGGSSSSSSTNSTNASDLIQKLKSGYPDHAYVQGLIRIETAFEREAIKYKVSSS